MSTEVSGDVVVCAAARTPFTRFDGPLRRVSLPELGQAAVSAALNRAGVPPEAVDEVAIGVNLPGADRSVARQIQLRAGIPDSRNAYTVDRACCSSLAAVSLVRRGLRLGETGVAIAGGAENLGRVPYFLDLRWGHRLGDVQLTDQLVISCPHTHVPRAVQAAQEAAAFGVTRAEQDDWALRSHQRYGAALEAGRLADEIVPVDLETVDGRRAVADRDESYRADVSLDKLAALTTVYGSDTVTAGNAPGLSAGASAVVLATEAAATVGGLPKLATIVSMARASGSPEKITSIPAEAASRALRLAGLDLDGIDLIEVNEAFAAVPLVTTLVLADGDRGRAEKLREIVNVNGGAVAIGHPTGATGARMLMTAAFELRRRGGGTALVTLCGGIGEAEAAVIRVAG